VGPEIQDLQKVGQVTPLAKRKHLARIASLGGQVAAASGQAAALGKKYGKINGIKIAKSGQLARAASLGGRGAVESGHLLSVTAWAHHVRWDINRGRSNPEKCVFCAAECRFRTNSFAC
jgi:hypothetical protein